MVLLAERSSSRNPTLPVLAGLLIKTLKKQLILTTTNLEVGFEASLPAKIEKEGRVVVPIKTILQLLTSIPDEELNLESSNNNLSLNSKGSSTKLKCLTKEDFPDLPKFSFDGEFKIGAKELTSAFRGTLVAAADNHLKPELASVFIFSKTRAPLTFVATDSFRLAENRTSLSVSPASLLLPQKSAQEAARIFEEVDGGVEIGFNKNQILFKSQNISFLSKLNEGGFPEYQSVIPKSFLTQVVLEKNKLINAVKAASVFSSRLSDVVLMVKPQENLLEISAASGEFGEHQSLLPAKVAGESLEISFNYHYLLDTLGVITEHQIFLGFNGPQKAVLVRGAGEGGSFHLVMPLRSV